MLLPAKHKNLVGLPGEPSIYGRISQLAQYVCKVPVVLVIGCQVTPPGQEPQPRRIQIVSQLGWEPGELASSLAQRLYEAVQTKSAGRSPPIARGISLYPPELAAAFAENLPWVKAWVGVAVRSPHQDLLGVLVVLDKQPRQLQPEQTALLQLLGQQLVEPLSDWATSTAALNPTPSTANGNGTSANPKAIALAQPQELLHENQRLRHLYKLSAGLQRCDSLAEVHRVLPILMRPLVQNTSGRVLLMNLAKTHLKEVLHWGDRPKLSQPCSPAHCPVVKAIHSCQCDDGWLLTNGKDPLGDCPLLTDDQGQLYNLCFPVKNANGSLIGILSFWGEPFHMPIENVWQLANTLVEQITFTLKRIHQLDILQNQSIRDPLTGLFNRRYLADLLPQLLNQAGHDNYPISLIMADIDHFKHINNQFGYLAGDQVLKDFALLLKGFVRGTDIACRYGGEEFVLILPDLSLHAAQQRAERIRQDLQYFTMRHGTRNLGSITLSVGVSSFPAHGITAEDLIAAADQALYQAKTTGRNRVIAYNPLKATKPTQISSPENTATSP